MEVIAFLQGGNTVVFDEVFREYHEKLYFYFLSKTKSDFMAKEIVQLTFIKIWRYRTNLNPDIPLAKQVFRIAKTTMIDFLRKQHVAASHTRKYASLSIPGSGSSNETLEKINENDLMNVVHSAIKGMPTVRRRVFEMSRISGMSNKEIASELSVSTKTVENHITQAIRHLRKSMPLYLLILMNWR
ncbi:RNA polymerase sigma-70 factor [Flavitalea flava]